MRVGAIETITDSTLCNVGPYGAEWLEREVPYKLALHLARQILDLYKGEIRREGSFAAGCTAFRLDLFVFSDEQLKEFVQFQVDKARKEKK